MPTIEPVGLEPLERAILDYLKTAREERTFDRLFSDIRGSVDAPSEMEAADRIVEAIFRLVRLELIELTPERKLRAVA